MTVVLQAATAAVVAAVTVSVAQMVTTLGSKKLVLMGKIHSMSNVHTPLSQQRRLGLAAVFSGIPAREQPLKMVFGGFGRSCLRRTLC